MICSAVMECEKGETSSVDCCLINRSPHLCFPLSLSLLLSLSFLIPLSSSLSLYFALSSSLSSCRSFCLPLSLSLSLSLAGLFSVLFIVSELIPGRIACGRWGYVLFFFVDWCFVY